MPMEMLDGLTKGFAVCVIGGAPLLLVLFYFFGHRRFSSELPATPTPSQVLPREKEVLLEEYRIVAEESRFAMTRYMQMLALYLALVGLVGREIMTNWNQGDMSLWLAGFGSIANFGGFYGAYWFRSMAYYYLDRQTSIANYMGLQQPHPMIWGYYGGLLMFTLVQVVFVLVVLIKLTGRLPFPTMTTLWH